MSFVGGGSDLPSFYRNHEGAVVSTAVDKYIYVTVNTKFDERIRISYSKTENVERIGEIEHPIVREGLKHLNVTGGIEVTSIADVPSSGTGLGSSSSFAVGFTNAMQAYLGRTSSARQLAETACHLEIDVLGEPIGKQDQYAAAFGGLNLIRFYRDETVEVRKLICKRETYENLEQSCLVFYTGKTRSASNILRTQSEAVQRDDSKISALKSMVFLANEMARQIENNSISGLGEILDENWKLKRALASGVTTEQIDEWYERGIRAGASGGKLLGAGSGGFLMFFAHSKSHSKIISALPELKPVRFGFERTGSAIIFVH